MVASLVYTVNKQLIINGVKMTHIGYMLQLISIKANKSRSRSPEYVKLATSDIHADTHGH